MGFNSGLKGLKVKKYTFFLNDLIYLVQSSVTVQYDPVQCQNPPERTGM